MNLDWEIKYDEGTIWSYGEPKWRGSSKKALKKAWWEKLVERVNTRIFQAYRFMFDNDIGFSGGWESLQYFGIPEVKG